MPIFLTDGGPPTEACPWCGGRKFYRGSKGSPAWRCAKCDPLEKCHPGGLPPNGEQVEIPKEAS